MDAEEQFRVTVKETVAALARRGKAARAWTADDGQTVSGWPVKYQPQQEKIEGNGGAWYRETRWGRTWILTMDGEFWEYAYDFTEEYNKDDENTHHLNRTPDSYWVGNRGKPFSEMTELLERLPYL